MWQPKAYLYQFYRKWANLNLSFGECRSVAYWRATESIYSVWHLIIMSYSILNLRFDGQRTEKKLPDTLSRISIQINVKNFPDGFISLYLYRDMKKLSVFSIIEYPDRGSCGIDVLLNFKIGIRMASEKSENKINRFTLSYGI